jgi:LPXTG-motif cell wall-anchored protein
MVSALLLMGTGVALTLLIIGLSAQSGEGQQAHLQSGFWLALLGAGATFLSGYLILLRRRKKKREGAAEGSK